MIGVDTNVLVRFFVQDDAKQGSLADSFLTLRTPDDPAFVSAVVVAELVWVLEQVYDFGHEQIHAALALLLASANVVVEREELLKDAIGQARDANADVADAIIAAVAINAGCERVMSFDRTAAKRIPGMELLK